MLTLVIGITTGVSYLSDDVDQLCELRVDLAALAQGDQRLVEAAHRLQCQAMAQVPYNWTHGWLDESYQQSEKRKQSISTHRSHRTGCSACNARRLPLPS